MILPILTCVLIAALAALAWESPVCAICTVGGIVLVLVLLTDLDDWTGPK
jgi:hypothetical protein